MTAAGMTRGERGASSSAPSRRQEPFVQVRPEAVEEVVGDLSFDAGAVLNRLLLLVDWRTGVLDGVTVASLAEHLGLAGGHGRRRLREALGELEADGVVRCAFVQGHEGRVEVLAYDRLVEARP